MWRDILIILGFALAALTWFRITPRRMLGYATDARTEVVKRRPIQRMFLFFAIGCTIATAYLIIFVLSRREHPLPIIFVVIVNSLFVWDVILHDVWEISERGEKILERLRYFVALPLFIAAVVLFDMPLWEKIAYPLGGFALGVGIHKLKDFVKRKRKGKKSL